MTFTPKNKKSPKPLTDPEDCTLSLHPKAMCLHPSCGGHSTLLSRQVFWLLDHPTDRPFPRRYPLSGLTARPSSPNTAAGPPLIHTGFPLGLPFPDKHTWIISYSYRLDRKSV